MIVYLTYIVSAVIIITKYFDCITTQRKIRGIGMEMNPIARVMMQKIGIKGTIWLIFGITIITTILCQVWIQLTTESILWDYGYILTGSITAIVQAATALNNHQGRPNFVTKQLFRLISKRASVIILMFASVLPSCSPSDESTLLETKGCDQGTAVEEKVQEKIGEGTKWIRYKPNEILYKGDKEVLPYPSGYLDSLAEFYTSTRFKDLISYSTSSEKEMELVSHAKEAWMNLKTVEVLDLRKFSTSFFDYDVDFSSNVDSIIYENEEFALVYLKMRPNDGSLYGGGIHPGLGYIVRLDKLDGRYSFSSSTGMIKYAMKYAADPYLMEVHLDHPRPYLEVHTSAGGVGIGREGVNLYDLEHLGDVIYSNVFLTYKNSIYWMPKEKSRVDWILEDLKVDFNEIGREVHVDGELDHQYILNRSRDSLEIVTSIIGELKTWSRNEDDSPIEFKDSIHGIEIHSYWKLW